MRYLLLYVFGFLFIIAMAIGLKLFYDRMKPATLPIKSAPAKRYFYVSYHYTKPNSWGIAGFWTDHDSFPSFKHIEKQVRLINREGEDYKIVIISIHEFKSKADFENYIQQ